MFLSRISPFFTPVSLKTLEQNEETFGFQPRTVVRKASRNGPLAKSYPDISPERKDNTFFAESAGRLMDVVLFGALLCVHSTASNLRCVAMLII